MPTTHYKEARICKCGYTTFGIRNWCAHKKTNRCKSFSEVNDKDARVASLEKQLSGKG